MNPIFATWEDPTVTTISRPVRRPRLVGLVGLLCLWLQPLPAAAADAPPLPEDSFETGETVGGGSLFIDGFGSCPAFEPGGAESPFTYRLEIPDGKNYLANIGGVEGLAGRVKVKRKRVEVFGEKRFAAKLKLKSSGEKKLKKWLRTSVRECIGDAEAKVKITKLLFRITTNSSGFWGLEPDLKIEAKVKSQGDKLRATLEN